MVNQTQKKTDSLVPASEVKVGDRIQVSCSMYPSEVMHKVTNVKQVGDLVYVYWGRQAQYGASFRPTSLVHIIR